MKSNSPPSGRHSRRARPQSSQSGHGQEPRDVDVGQQVGRGTRDRRRGQHRREQREGVGGELAAEETAEALVAGGHRGGEHAGQVDGESHQSEQQSGGEDAAQGRPVASETAVDQAGDQDDDQHDRAEDVADAHEQVAEHQRGQRVGPADHGPAERPPDPGQECPDHLGGRPRGQVEVLRHAAHGDGDGGDVRRGRRCVVGADEAEGAERADHGERHLDRRGEDQQVRRDGGQEADAHRER